MSEEEAPAEAPPAEEEAAPEEAAPAEEVCRTKTRFFFLLRLYLMHVVGVGKRTESASRLVLVSCRRKKGGGGGTRMVLVDSGG